MAHKNFRCSAVSQRSQTMLNMVMKTTDIETSTENNKQQKKTVIYDKKIIKNVEQRDYLVAIYSRDYSMTSDVFEKFSETKTTFNLHGNLPDFENTLMLLNKSFPREETQESIKIQDTQTINNESTFDLKCYEVLSPKEQEHYTSQPNLGYDFDSDKPLAEKDEHNLIISKPSNLQIDPLTKDIEIEIWFESDNYKEQEQRTPPPNSVSDFDSDDSVRDKDYNPSHSSNSSDDEDEDVSKSQMFHTSKKTTPNKNIPSDAVQTIEHTASLQTPNDCSNNIENNLDELLPDQSQTRKRKKITPSLEQRKMDAKNKRKLEHGVKAGCNEKCLKRCSTKMTQEDRVAINKMYWEMSWKEQHSFVEAHTAVAIPKRRITTDPKRKPKRIFLLKNLEGSLIEVCKIYFLTTLGYLKTNDRILHSNFTQFSTDRRGKHQKTAPICRDLLSHHVESFHPLEPHHRREHAPLRRYLPSDLNIVAMHKHFCELYPEKKVSYELYRKHVKQMNISFTPLGNEECSVCEAYDLHKKSTLHENNQLNDDCIECVKWLKHHDKYTKARQLYSEHKSLPQNNYDVYFSADLEKVIMLPRLDTFKVVIFCQRLVAFNQTFAPLGKITSQSKPLTVLWHDAISGREQEDIMSAFYYFILRHRDVTNIHIWLDNCTSQNKNWLLFSLLVDLVNSELISTDQIILYYFEPGHTFMSADQVHHQVELAMKKKGKLYDFHDFEQAVATINNSKVDLKSMQTNDFLIVPSYVSDRRIQTSNPRAYLREMSQVCFSRHSFDLKYKNNFEDEYTSLRFMNDKYFKNPSILKIEFRTEPKGIDAERKSDIIKKLSLIIPPHKLLFWKDLPIKKASEESTSKKKKRTRLIKT